MAEVKFILFIEFRKRFFRELRCLISDWLKKQRMDGVLLNNDLALLSTGAEIYQTLIETLQTACSHWFLFFNFINVYYHVV